MHFSPQRSVTAVPGVIAVDALGPARSRLIAPDSLSSMNIRYRGYVQVTPRLGRHVLMRPPLGPSLRHNFVMFCNADVIFYDCEKCNVARRLRILKYVNPLGVA